MAKYDPENLLHDIKSMLVTKINAAIDIVEAEKVAQGLPATSLAHIDTTADLTGREAGFFEQNWSDAILNVSPAIFYGIEDIKTEGMGPVTAQTITVFIEVIVIDKQADTLMERRIHRYSRAIRDVLEANYDQLPCAARTRIETLKPVSFRLDMNSSDEVRVGGVSVITSLA